MGDYLSGALDEAGCARLHDAIQSNPDLLEELASFEDVDILLHFLARTTSEKERLDKRIMAGLGSQSSRKRFADGVIADIESVEKSAARVSHKSRRLSLFWPLAAAAGIAAVLAAWWVSGEWQPARNAAPSAAGGAASGRGQALARVETVDSGQWTVDSKTWADLKKGDQICEGMRIEVGEKGKVVLAYEVGAKVELGAGSILSMRPMSPKGPTSPISKLERGTLTADVEKRSAFDGVFAVLTPHAVCSCQEHQVWAYGE